MTQSTKTIAYKTPDNTPLLGDGGKISLTWGRFFKMLGDNWMLATVPTQKTVATGSIALTYLLTGAVCNIFHDLGAPVVVDTVIALPFTSALPFIAYNTEYLAGTSAVTVPAGKRVVAFSYAISN